MIAEESRKKKQSRVKGFSEKERRVGKHLFSNSPEKLVGTTGFEPATP